MRYALRNYQPRVRPVPMHRKREESLQKQVCSYLRLRYPNIIFRSDYASGLGLTMNQAVTHRSLQSSRSWPDLQIVHPSRGYHALFIELKKDGTTIYVKRGPRKGEMTADQHVREQALMLEALNRLGYFARFAVGFDNAQRIIDWYLNPDYREHQNSELF